MYNEDIIFLKLQGWVCYKYNPEFQHNQIFTFNSKYEIICYTSIETLELNLYNQRTISNFYKKIAWNEVPEEWILKFLRYLEVNKNYIERNNYEKNSHY